MLIIKRYKFKLSAAHFEFISFILSFLICIYKYLSFYLVNNTIVLYSKLLTTLQIAIYNSNSHLIILIHSPFLQA